MRKIICSIFLVCVLLLTLTGCSSEDINTNTSKSYTFKVETGDLIEIKLNTSDGYDLSSDLPFAISKDDEELSQGTFITMEGYDKYIDNVNKDINSEVLDSGTKNGITYTFYSYNDSEYNYIIKVNDSNTGILLGNPNSREEAETIFDLLTFSVEE